MKNTNKKIKERKKRERSTQQPPTRRFGARAIQPRWKTGAPSGLGIARSFRRVSDLKKYQLRGVGA
jgi:hypothetical protein